METSIKGICAILAHEAIVLQTYRDAVNVLTIGAGHTKAAGVPNPKPGLKITLLEALNIFRKDLKKYEAEVKDAVRVPLTQQQFDALVSWHYNTGSIKTATLTEKLNNSDFTGAAKEFARWNKADGRVLNGLVNRRKEETSIFVDGNYGSPVVKVHQVHKDRPKRLGMDDIKKLFSDVGSTEEDMTTEELLANPASRLLPKFRPRQTEEISRASFEKFIDLVPQDRRDDAVKILAVRGYYANTLGEQGVNDRNFYDDAIFVLHPLGVHNFNANTDPSKFRRGIAKLKAPQAVRYVPGPHGFKRKNGPYPAFRQDSKCTVERDQTGDETGIFWINLHRGGVTTTSSAGCQTIPPHQWNEFKALVDNLLETYSQKTFYYILIDQADVVPEADVVVKPPVVTPPVIKPPVTPPIPVPTPRPTPPPVPGIKPPIPGIPPRPDGKPGTRELLLLLLLKLVRGGKGRTPGTMPKTGKPGSASTVISETPPQLTEVNAALGTTIGRLLDGRKTAIGILGLLAAALVPELNPALADLLGMDVETAVSAANTGQAAVVEALTETLSQNGQTITESQSVSTTGAPTTSNLWYPIFSAMAAWGVLGKIEKWVFMLSGNRKEK